MCHSKAIGFISVNLYFICTALQTDGHIIVAIKSVSCEAKAYPEFRNSVFYSGLISNEICIPGGMPQTPYTRSLQPTNSYGVPSDAFGTQTGVVKYYMYSSYYSYILLLHTTASY